MRVKFCTFAAVKIGLKWALIGLSGLFTRAYSQKSVTLTEILPKLKTHVAAADIEKSLQAKGFVLKPNPSSKSRVFSGIIDSTQVELLLRKTSRKGLVWGYRIVFLENESGWVNKRKNFERQAQIMSVVLEQSPANTIKTLPQYCKDKEALCFRDGVAKFQSSWYWNNAVQRIKTIDLLVNTNFELTIEITDNELETEVN